MSTYRVFSEWTPPGGVTIIRYAAKIELDPEVADSWIRESPTAPIIPEEEFEKFFPPGPQTDAALEQHSSTTSHGEASVEFQEQAHGVRLWHYNRTMELRAAPPKAAAAVPIPVSDGAVKAESEG